MTGKNKYFLIALLILAFFLLVFFYFRNDKETAPADYTPPTTKQEGPPEIQKEQSEISPPIENAEERITKKPFGIYITPQNSPVQPERFTGYHTGTDFETSPEEQGGAVDVFSICKGKVIQKSEVTGYGGLLIQNCAIGGQTVTVLYGHINISETPEAGVELEKNTKIATLADAYSRFSGFERKHLHLGIHKGSGIVYLGYVNSQDTLTSWLNAEDYF